MAYPYERSSEKQVSIFNETANKIRRLDEGWVEARKQRESGNLVRWRWILDSQQIELSDPMTKIDKDSEEKERYSNKIKELDNKIEKTFEDGLRLKKLNKPWKGYVWAEFYRILKDKEIMLRAIQEEAGLGTKYKGTDEDEMD